MAATGSRDIVATDVVVPERRVSLMPPPHLLAKPGDPYLHRIPIAPFLSLTAAMPAIGAAKRALALFEDRLFDRVMFGTKRTQSARVPTQVRLANLRVEVDFAETLMRDIADRMQAHAEGRIDLDLLGQLHLRLGIAHIVRRCRDVVREIMQSSGASVHYLDNELQRIHRDVHMMCAHTVFDVDLVAEGVGRQIVASKEAPRVAMIVDAPEVDPQVAHVGREVLAGEGGAGGDELGGGALEDDLAAVVAGAGPEVDDPVGVRHHGLVVCDHDHRLPGVHQPVEQTEQLLHVGEVQARGRFVEDEDVALLPHVGGELEPLPLTAGQRGEGLTEADVPEPDVGQLPEDLVGGRNGGVTGAEELLGLGDGHGEHLGDVLAAELVLQDLGLVPLPLAQLAGGGDPGHDRQVAVDDPGAVAGGAGALGVGAEQGRLHPVCLREGLADRVEQARVGRRVAAPRAADRGLVDHHHALPLRQRAVHERALPGAGHTGHHHQHAERDVDVDVAQVVGAGTADLQGPDGGPHGPP